MADITHFATRCFASAAAKPSLLAAITASLILLPLQGKAQQMLDPATLDVLDENSPLTFQGVSIDQLEDMNVIRNGDVIGEVEEVLANQNDEIAGLAIEYGGNRLGIGEKEVVVPINEVQLTHERKLVIINLTDEELGRMPPWND